MRIGHDRSLHSQTEIIKPCHLCELLFGYQQETQNCAFLKGLWLCAFAQKETTVGT